MQLLEQLQSLVTSYRVPLVAYDKHQTHSPVRSYTDYWGGLEVRVIRLQLLCEITL